MRRESTRVSLKRCFHIVWPAVILTVVFMLLPGCIVYEPVPAVVPVPEVAPVPAVVPEPE